MIEVGDILICRGKSIISKTIMLVSKGTWSHAAIAAEAWGENGVIEAQSNGVNFKFWHVWVHKWGYKYEVFRFNEEFDKKALMWKSFGKCGETGYDWFTLFRRAFGKRSKRKDSKENKRMTCIEFVCYVWNIPNGYDMTPEELYKYLIKNKQWTKI